MALFRGGGGVQEYIALDAYNITLAFDSGNIVSISDNILLFPPQGYPISYKHCKSNTLTSSKIRGPKRAAISIF